MVILETHRDCKYHTGLVDEQHIRTRNCMKTEYIAFCQGIFSNTYFIAIFNEKKLSEQQKNKVN